MFLTFFVLQIFCIHVAVDHICKKSVGTTEL